MTRREEIPVVIAEITDELSKLRALVTTTIGCVFLFLSTARLAFTQDSMAFPGADWQESPPAAQGVDPDKLAKAVAYLEEHSGPDGVRELVVIRNGYLIWKGDDIDKVHGIWSCTKSFTSTVLGLLIDDGKCSLETKAASVLPELAKDYPEVTLEHFTTMTSGYRAEGDEPKGSYVHGPSSTPFRPSEPLFTPPGMHYAYWDSAMNELAHVLTRIAGEPIEELFRRRIAEPIGMDPDVWDWGDFGEVDGIVVNGGAGNGGKHVKISAREIARLGHLFLNRGRWDGKQLVSEAWVEQATRASELGSFLWTKPDSGIDGRGYYGFNWWHNWKNRAGAPKWPGAPAGTFAARGHNNNSVFVIPEWRMVIVRLGLDQKEHEITDIEYGSFLALVGEALGGEWARAWRFSAPRDEIAPRAWQYESARFEGDTALALAGDGLDATHGRWTRTFDVAGGMHVRFETHFRTTDVEEPARSVLARVLWRGSDGETIGRPEYPRTLLPGDTPASAAGWSLIRESYAVPSGATAADVELVYRWDADGTVHFAGTRLETVDAPPARKVRLASVHHRPRGSKGPAENLEAFARLVGRAAAKQADIVCLPEGITVVGTGKSYAEVAEPIPGPSTRRLGEAAREHRVWIVAGIYERAGQAIYNTAVLLDREGHLAGTYRKVCLPREEIEGGITPGDELPVFDTDFGRVGMMICWDVFFPEPARELAQKGAEVILLPIWGGNLNLAKARAIENQVYLVSSTYDMKTAVFDQEGEILAEGTDENPVIVVEVDLAERKLWPWLGDFRARIPREMPPARALGGGAR